MSRLSKIALSALALAVAPVAVARAQDTADPYNPSRFTVEPYLSQTWVESDLSDDRDALGGFGVRVMFGRADASQIVSSLVQRARAGAFFTYNAEQKDDISSYHIGGELDFPLFSAPRDANTPLRLDPFVSLGAGIFHVARNIGGGVERSTNDFALTPAIGILLPITGEIKFRGDLRDAIVFGDKTYNNFGAEGGISIGF